jgi:hypothetical protein
MHTQKHVHYAFFITHSSLCILHYTFFNIHLFCFVRSLANIYSQTHVLVAIHWHPDSVWLTNLFESQLLTSFVAHDESNATKVKLTPR